MTKHSALHDWAESMRTQPIKAANWRLMRLLGWFVSFFVLSGIFCDLIFEFESIAITLYIVGAVCSAFLTALGVLKRLFIVYAPISCDR